MGTGGGGEDDYVVSPESCLHFTGKGHEIYRTTHWG